MIPSFKVLKPIKVAPIWFLAAKDNQPKSLPAPFKACKVSSEPLGTPFKIGPKPKYASIIPDIVPYVPTAAVSFQKLSMNLSVSMNPLSLSMYCSSRPNNILPASLPIIKAKGTLLDHFSSLSAC